MQTPSYFLLLITLELAACGSVPMAPTDEVPLQPAAMCPSAYENLGGPTEKDKKTP